MAPDSSPTWSHAGLPEPSRWRSRELLYSAPSRSLLAIVEDVEGEWHELRLYIRRLGEQQYRLIQPPSEEVDFHDFTVSPDRQLVYTNVFRRIVSPMSEQHQDKRVPIEEKVNRGYEWEGVYTISLPEGKLTRLPIPEGFRPAPEYDWISRIIGADQRGLLYVLIGVSRPLMSDASNNQAQFGRRIDYYLAEYETDSGAMRQVSLMMSPFH